MVESPVCSTGLTNIITTNPISHTMVTLFWLLNTDKKAQCQASERTSIQTRVQKFQAQGKVKN